MITKEQYEEAMTIVNQYLGQINDTAMLIERKSIEPTIPINNIPRKILSYRAYNVLKEKVQVNYLSELDGMKYSDLFKYRNLGHKTLNEIQACCEQYGITLINDSTIQNNLIIFNNNQL